MSYLELIPAALGTLVMAFMFYAEMAVTGREKFLKLGCRHGDPGSRCYLRLNDD